jgi:hypothetical protein
MAKKIIKNIVKVDKKSVGRPIEYNFDMCKEICEKVSNGENIFTILKSNDKYPCPATFRSWKESNDELLTLYTRSVQTKAEAVDSQIDDTIKELRSGKIDPATARVIIDTLKWKASKYYPKMFGTQQIDITSDGKEIKHEPVKIFMIPDNGRDKIDDAKLIGKGK